MFEVSWQELHPRWSPSLWAPEPLVLRTCWLKSELPGPPLSVQWAAEAMPAEPRVNAPVMTAAASELRSFLLMCGPFSKWFPKGFGGRAGAGCPDTCAAGARSSQVARSSSRLTR